jgi:PAS domain S-box-containing protein
VDDTPDATPSEAVARLVPADDITRARLAAIVESSDDAIVSKTLEGIVTSWNSGAERVFGYTSEEMVGQPITKIIPEDRLDEEPQILSRLRRGERVDHFETIRRRKDGTLIDVSVTISPVRDSTGRIVGASKIARDVTAQKQFQRELHAAKEAADAANRAKDQFLSVLSHELRTPLTPVLAAVSYIEQNPSLASELLAEQIGMIRRNVETQARLVDDLLDLTRITRGKVELHFEAVDANAVLRDALTMVRPDADAKHLSVTTEFRATEPHVWADPGRLQQVFWNILSNAVKFTPDGGAIAIRTADGGEGHLRAEVQDTGVGIDPQFLPKLFIPFEQGESTITRRFGGLGLGLSIVKSIMDMHGANVMASSGGVGRGATFTIELPIAEKTTGARPSTSAAAAASLIGDDATVAVTRRILLVEDHADTRFIMARLLTSFGFAVSTAGSVREAIELGEGKRFDLLISDIGLPDGSGMDIMRHLRQSQPIHGIALSGYGLEDDLRRSAEAGFAQHLTKPINVHTLREIVMRIAG